ncbi:hypothetical protein ACK2J6_003709 [Vibrio fluvialis]|nr:hypothetical protein [Vibrio fluvialis]
MLNNLIFISPIFLIFSSIVIYVIEPENNITWSLVFLCNVFYLIRFVRVIPIFLIFAFISLYTFEPYHFFVRKLYISHWVVYQDACHLNQAIILNGIFLVIFGSVLFNVNRDKIIDINSFISKNNIIRNFLLASFFVVAHFSLSGETILEGGYGSSEVFKYPIFEYSLVLLVLALCYGEVNNSNRIIFGVAASFFCIKSLLYGGRIEVLQCLFIYMYFFTNFFRTWSLKKLYISILTGFIFLTVIGAVRADPERVVKLIENPVSVLEAKKSDENDVVSSNYGDILQASARMIGLKDDGIWGLDFRTQSFFSYVFNIFLYGTEYKDYSNLAWIDQSNYGAGGGGYISSYFYVWVDWLGVVISSFGLSIILRNSVTGRWNNDFVKVYGFMILVTFPRWYGYSPISLVKICLIAAILHTVIKFFVNKIWKR